MRSLSIKAKMLAVFALIAFAMAVVAMIAIRGVSLLNDDLSELYQQRLVPVSQLAHINDLMHVSVEQLTIAIIARPSPQNVQKYIDRVETNLADVDSLARKYTQHVASDEDRKRLGEWNALRNELVEQAIKPAIATSSRSPSAMPRTPSSASPSRNSPGCSNCSIPSSPRS